MLVHEYLQKHALENSDKEAIVFHGRRVTYAEYLDMVDRAAAALLRLGVERGDHVALYINNSPEYVFSYIATMSLGAAAVPVSTRFADAEAGFVVGNSDSSLLVTVPGFGGIDFLEVTNKIVPKCPELETVVVMGSPGDVARVEGAVSGDELTRELTNEDRAALGEARSKVRQDDVAFMVYTSGTTGVPKAAMLTHRNVIAYVIGQVDASGVTSRDRLLLDIPVNHVGGGVMAIICMVYIGGTLVILDAFNPTEVLKTVQDERITVMGQVPAQYILMMMSPDFDNYDLSSVRAAVVSAAPSPKELFAQVKEKFGVYPTNGFGLSEVSGAVTFNRVDMDPFERLSSSIGKPNVGIEVSIKDADGDDLPAGEGGEICIRGDAVMKGYYKMPEETALVTTPDGYFRTGDMGTVDSDGYVYILGRKKEMYIRGGENVYPPEVEEVLQEHPKVLFSAVIGVPDPVMGEVGRAYIVVHPAMGEPPTEEEIKAWSADHLARYKVPTEVVFRDSLPLTPLGKVMKKALYEELKGETGHAAKKPAKKSTAAKKPIAKTPAKPAKKKAPAKKPAKKKPAAKKPAARKPAKKKPATKEPAKPAKKKAPAKKPAKKKASAKKATARKPPASKKSEKPAAAKVPAGKQPAKKKGLLETIIEEGTRIIRDIARGR